MTKKVFIAVVICIVGFVFTTAAWAQDDRKVEATGIVDKSRVVVEEMLMSMDNQVPSELIAMCDGIVIVPGMLKGGFFLGGSYGDGVVLARHGNSFSGPAFLSMGAGSIGLQFGVQQADIILVIFGKNTMDSFLMNNKFKLGGDMALVAGPVGAQLTAATDLMLNGGIYSYSRSQGLFAGISLEGAGISMNHALNQAYYGNVWKPTEILSTPNLLIPESGDKLIKALERASQRGDDYKATAAANKEKNKEIDKQMEELELRQQELDKQRDALEKQRP